VQNFADSNRLPPRYDMPLKLLTLNIESDRHLPQVHAALTEHKPDIACLQEVFESDCEYLASSVGYHVKHASGGRIEHPSGPDRSWGIAVLSRVPVLRQTVTYYADDPSFRVIRQPNDPRRGLVITELEHEGRPYRIITTHFTWTPNGQISDEQQADFARMQALLRQYPDYVLCGDFNAPRGRAMFAKFVDELGLIDHLPGSVRSTLDPRFHKAAPLELVVDTVFSTPQYQVADIRVLEGISDHKGIVALLERTPTD
jgi:endonuclease/exonuclease/phosphatase family metal-dependent hydrolase